MADIKAAEEMLAEAKKHVRTDATFHGVRIVIDVTGHGVVLYRQTSSSDYSSTELPTESLPWVIAHLSDLLAADGK